MRLTLLSLVSFVAALIFLPSDSATAQADPSLVQVSVRFKMPDCDDRDDDTNIHMAVHSQGGVLLAEDKSIAGKKQFRDPGNYGPFVLPLKSTVTKSNWIGTKTSLLISTKGHDTWCTEIFVEALFSDNSKTETSACNLVKVSEKNRQFNFVNAPC